MTPAPETDDPFSRLQRSFHEPKRLAIVSSLIGEPTQTLSFSELKEACDLTDGNLNRHLKVLDEAGVVTMEKTKGNGRPSTSVQLTASGRNDFLAYLESLEAVLRQASKAAKGTEKTVAKQGLPHGAARARA